MSAPRLVAVAAVARLAPLHRRGMPRSVSTRNCLLMRLAHAAFCSLSQFRLRTPRRRFLVFPRFLCGLSALYMLCLPLSVPSFASSASSTLGFLCAPLSAGPSFTLVAFSTLCPPLFPSPCLSSPSCLHIVVIVSSLMLDCSLEFSDALAGSESSAAFALRAFALSPGLRPDVGGILGSLWLTVVCAIRHGGPSQVVMPSKVRGICSTHLSETSSQTIFPPLRRSAFASMQERLA